MTQSILPKAIPVRAMTYGIVIVPAPTVQAMRFRTEEFIEPAWNGEHESVS